MKKQYIKWEVIILSDGYYIVHLNEYRFFNLIPVYICTGAGTTLEKAKVSAFSRKEAKRLERHYSFKETLNSF